MAKTSLTRGKAIFIVDLLLIPVFILVMYSGLKFHVAGHSNGYNHNTWEFWAHYHILASIVSLIIGWFHIKAHWGWYKSLAKKGFKKKSKITIGLSLVFFVLIVTGIVLVFFVEGANSKIGLWHYGFGLIMIALMFLHLFKRFCLLLKGLGWRIKK